MAGEGSVTRWLGAVREGDEAAAQELWNRYFAQQAAEVGWGGPALGVLAG